MLERFLTDKNLSSVSTLGIGGPAKYYVEVKTVEELQEVLCFCSEHKLPTFILGKGSNCLFDSRGIERVVIHNKIDFYLEPEPGHFYVGAGFSFSLLGHKSARQGYTGLEFASGIPASCGGAVFMNAGAQGGETWDSLKFIDYVDQHGKVRRYSKDELAYGYRKTAFHTMQGAIASAYFVLAPQPDARATQLKLLDLRIHSQPYQDKSAGCVFKNPPNAAAGMLIDKCGLKGYQIGGAKVSELHANFLVNSDHATSSDFRALIAHVRQKVHDMTGYDLHQEIFWVSDDEVL